MPIVTRPAVSANLNTDNDIFRKKKDACAGALELPPKSYGKLRSAPKDTIKLVGGEYHFEEVIINAGSTVVIDLTNDQPLVVQIAGKLNLGAKVRMEVVGGDASGVLVLVEGRKATIGAGGTYVGTFVAPNGQVVLGTKATLTGAAWAGKVVTKALSSVTAVPYDHHLP